jgi:hypothetical protein
MTVCTKGLVSIAASCLFAGFMACGGSDATTNPDGGSTSHVDAPPTSNGPGIVNGIVSDIGTGGRVEGATVEGGGQTATTDAQGQFTLTGLASGNVNLAISKTDYAPGFASAQVGDSPAAVVATLKRQGTLQTYNAGMAVTLSEKTEAGPYAVIFQPNSLDTTDTNLKVSITPLDPTKERPALPGTLVTGGANPAPLIPVTFAEFTILDSSGRRVNLKSSANATVELPIPPPLRGSYPSGTKIHCYAYDSATGVWEDFVEGTVQTSSVDGTSPVLAASVRHFSWYGGAPEGTNCVDTYVSVVSAVDGTPLQNARVEATPGTVAFTDQNGSALVRSAIGSTSSTYTAYQTGIDVDGSLTGMAGAKYIEFGVVTEDLVGLVTKPCTSSISPPPDDPGHPDVVGTHANPVVVKIGVVKNLLTQATAIITAGEDGSGTGGSITVILEQGVPGPSGELVNPMPASGAIVELQAGNAAPVTLAELAAGTGLYGPTGALTVVPGQSYFLTIDTDGDGSVDATSSIVAVGQLAWTSPLDGADVAAAGFTASFTDSGTQAGNPAYAPVYFASIVSTEGTFTDGAFYIGTDRSFPVTSFLAVGTDLMPGSYSASLTGFSGFFSGAGGIQVANNITGTGVTGTFYSASTVSAPVMFTVH